MHDPIPMVASKQRWTQVTRWLALCGVIAPIQFVIAFTLLGALRPGYSSFRQAVSDLGVGPNGWVMNISIVLDGLLLIACALGFALGMQSILSRGWRWTSAILLTLPGLGLVVAGIFSEAPETLVIHWMVGAILLFLSPVIVFPIAGFALRHDARWRRWSFYSFIAGLLTLALVILMFWVFTPGTTLASLQIGGLMERVVIIEIEIWYLAFGWRLFTSS